MAQEASLSFCDILKGHCVTNMENRHMNLEVILVGMANVERLRNLGDIRFTVYKNNPTKT